MSDLSFAPATRLAALIRARRLSPLELMEHCLARIEALNPRLNAFVALDAEGALAQAREQTERLARGEDLGPLGGLPLGVKDTENAAGLVTSYGSLLFADNLALADDVHVARLRRAGAIVLGKTNCPEFGYTAFTANRLYGVTRNPWNLERTPGGSSGGSAAALAAGLVPLATASDGGGSVRIPACYCGLVGLKPQFGRVPIAPRRLHSWLAVTACGALARTVADAALYLQVVAGPHPADPASLPPGGLDWVQALEEPLPRLRLGFDPSLGVTRVDDAVMHNLVQVLEALEQAGHRVEPRQDSIPEMGRAWLRMYAFQALAMHWDDYHSRRDLFDPGFLAEMDLALEAGPRDFREFYLARGQLVEWTCRLFEEVDLLLTPTLPTEPFAAEGPLPRERDGQPFNFIGFTYPFNLTGHPAISVPAGLTPAGLPCGLQIVAPRFREDLLLRLAREIEEIRPWSGLRPAMASGV
jgi:Asp-tRNA(Asn)/Glu-tRNA(Gln) amidotransferase A subunit family amidase